MYAIRTKFENTHGTRVTFLMQFDAEQIRVAEMLDSLDLRFIFNSAVVLKVWFWFTILQGHDKLFQIFTFLIILKYQNILSLRKKHICKSILFFQE